MILEITDEDQMQEVHIFTTRKQCAQEVKFISIFSKKKPQCTRGLSLSVFSVKKNPMY
jgi:hypothetical protein